MRFVAPISEAVAVCDIPDITVNREFDEYLSLFLLAGLVLLYYQHCIRFLITHIDMVYILALIADIYHIVTPIQVFGIIELPPDMPGFPAFFSSEALKSSCHPRSVYPFGKTNLFPLGFGIFSFSIFFNRGIILLSVLRH